MRNIIHKRIRQLLSLAKREEGATAAIEYIAVVPGIVMIAFAMVQLLMGVQAALMATSAAREAARAAVVCDDVGTAINNAAPGFEVTSYGCSGGGGRGNAVTCSVTVKVPAIAFNVGSVTSRATMRQETCK